MNSDGSPLSRKSRSEVGVKKRRTFNVKLVKMSLSYTIIEIAELFEVHPQAVRRWIKLGLHTIDQHKPYLIHGTDLVAFLKARQSQRRRKCQVDEFYCCKCREPRRALNGSVNVNIFNRRILNLEARCQICQTRMNRKGATAKLNEYQEIFSVHTITDQSI